jgi:hypothetical protein
MLVYLNTQIIYSSFFSLLIGGNKNGEKITALLDNRVYENANGGSGGAGVNGGCGCAHNGVGVSGNGGSGVGGEERNRGGKLNFFREGTKIPHMFVNIPSDGVYLGV